MKVSFILLALGLVAVASAAPAPESVGDKLKGVVGNAKDLFEGAKVKYGPAAKEFMLKAVKVLATADLLRKATQILGNGDILSKATEMIKGGDVLSIAKAIMGGMAGGKAEEVVKNALMELVKNKLGF